jgi:hypothetical protein
VLKNFTLDKARWESNFKGFNIVDCAIWERNKFIFGCKKDVPDDEYDVIREGSIATRYTTVTLDTEETKSGGLDLSGFRFPRCGIARGPVQQALLASRQNDGCIFWANKEKKYGLDHITPDGEENPKGSAYVYKLKCIDGYAYAASFGRIIHKQVAHGQWIPLTNGLIWPEKMDSSNMGFHDIHGPNESNMYAVGGCGDVWHYNGEKWQWCDFPSNEQLSCVLVTPDGDVYISGEGGNLWRGKMHTWEKIHTGSSSVLNKDLVWYNNQVWVSSDYQLRVWNGKELVRPVHNGKEIIMSGNMDVYENLLLVADLNTVKLFDGTDWHTIVRPYE